MSEQILQNIDQLLSPRIPLEVPSVTGWKDVPINQPKTQEQLVPLGPFSDFSKIATSSIYFGEHSDSPYKEGALDGSLVTVFVRQGVAEQLNQANAALPRGLHLVVFDAYRPLNVQRALFDFYFTKLKSQHTDWNEERLLTETQKYVSLPRSPRLDPAVKFVSPHNTGGAVDLAIYALPEEIENEVQTLDNRINEIGGDFNNWQEVYSLESKRNNLVNKGARMLKFGTAFDYGGAEAALNYFEVQETKRTLTPEEKEAQLNRRALYNLMKLAGFESYADEWWHFNSKKTQMGAKTAGLAEAEYGSAELSEDNKKHEEMRKAHRLGSIRMFEGVAVTNPSEAFRVAKRAVNETGDIRLTVLPRAEVIQPTQTI